MKSSALNTRGLRWVLLILVVCSWMSMGVLSNCDPAIADQVITGVGSATASVASTVIVAVFDSIKPPVRQPVTTTGT